MNYLRIYENLVLFRQQHSAEGYTENHHIIMRSLGGSDEPSNLVRLTGREHWVAHLLLHKIYRKPQTAHACHMMAMRCEERGIPYIRNSRMYEEIRKECAKLASSRMKGLQKGSKNSQFGTMWICNLNTMENRKVSKNFLIPEGWVLGRNKWKQKYFNKSKFGSKEHRQRAAAGQLGKRLSVETKQKISRANKISRLGNKSLSGRIWINNGIINKAILKTDIIPEGFIKGKISRHKCYVSTPVFQSGGVS